MGDGKHVGEWVLGRQGNDPSAPGQAPAWLASEDSSQPCAKDSDVGFADHN